MAQYLGPYAEISTVTTPIEQMFSGGIIDAIVESVDRIASYMAVIGGVVLHMFLALSIAFYLLTGGPDLSQWVMKNFADDR